MAGSTLLFLIGTCIALFVIFPYLRSDWHLDNSEKPKRRKRKRHKLDIERLMDAGTNDVAEGWKQYMQLDEFEDLSDPKHRQ